MCCYLFQSLLLVPAWAYDGTSNAEGEYHLNRQQRTFVITLLMRVNQTTARRTVVGNNILPGESPVASGTSKGFLLRVGPKVTLEVLRLGKGL